MILIIKSHFNTNLLWSTVFISYDYERVSLLYWNKMWIKRNYPHLSSCLIKWNMLMSEKIYKDAKDYSLFFYGIVCADIEILAF